MNRALNLAGQVFLYACFALVLAVFSQWPTYHPLDAGMAQIKISLMHHGERLEPCRPYTEEELAKLAPNMRKSEKCGRERTPVSIELALDGKQVLSHTAAPAGLSRDGASTMYKRLDVPAGEHHVSVRLTDGPAPDNTHTLDETIILAPAQVLVVDFNADKGGIVLQ